MSVPNFDDLGENENELFTRSFPSKSHVEISTEQSFSNSIKIKSSVKREIEKGHQNIGFVFNPTFASKIYGLNLLTKGKIVSSSQIGDHSVALEISPEDIPDLAFEIGSEVGAEDRNDPEVSYYGQLSYSTDKVNVNAKVNNSSEGTTLNGSGILQYPENVYWGVNGFVKKGEDKYDFGWDAKIQFAFPKHSTTVFF